MTEAILKDFST